MLRASLLISCAVVLGLSALPAAAQDDLESRLMKLEKDYVELLMRDREKAQELDRVQAELDALRGGRPPPPAPTPVVAPASTGHAGHDHGAHDHAGHDDGSGHAHGPGAGDVLVESGRFRFWTPSIGLDFLAYGDDAGRESLEERFGELRGFGGGHDHDHEGDDHAGHGHGILKDGFNLRHAEIGLAAELVGFGRLQALINLDTDGIEAEEVYFQSDRIADLASVRLGRFRSGFGFFNERHSPEWAFADAPMAHYLIFGDHGLRDLGARLNLAPAGSGLEFGVEAFQGDGETLFARVDGAGKAHDPGLVVAWAKASVWSSGGTSLRLGMGGGYGQHQQALAHHDDHDHEDEDHDHEDEDHDAEAEAEVFGHGDAWFITPGFELVHRAGGLRGQGDVVLRGEYIHRVISLDVLGEGTRWRSAQDGYHIEGIYGVAPGLDAGLRFGQVGLTNNQREAGMREAFGDSWRLGGLAAYRFNDWSRVSVQTNYGRYDFEDGRKGVFQALARFTMQLGPHLH